MEALISSIVTTKNEEDVIGNLLESLQEQSYQNFEIVIVDNFSSDKTVEIVRRYSKNIYEKGPERSTQRNFGVKMAHGDYIIILDSDMVLEKNVLKDCVQTFNKHDKLGALVIPEKSFGIGFWSRCKAYEREFYVGEESIEAPRSFRRNLFLKFGGYDASITGPEDYELPLRMKKKGIKIGRIKSFILHNEKKFSPFKSAKKKFYYASRASNYLKKHPKMALAQGNLLFRPVFFKKWRKLISNPILSVGMFIMRMVEVTGALLGFIYSLLTQSILRSIIR